MKSPRSLASRSFRSKTGSRSARHADSSPKTRKSRSGAHRTTATKRGKPYLEKKLFVFRVPMFRKDIMVGLNLTGKEFVARALQRRTADGPMEFIREVAARWDAGRPLYGQVSCAENGTLAILFNFVAYPDPNGCMGCIAHECTHLAQFLMRHHGVSWGHDADASDEILKRL
jgi:hypothetical protein